MPPSMTFVASQLHLGARRALCLSMSGALALVALSLKGVEARAGLGGHGRKLRQRDAGRSALQSAEVHLHRRLGLCILCNGSSVALFAADLVQEVTDL
jgi:hypothetical protein